MTTLIENPCIRCGACCAFFRASFHYMEADDCKTDGVPVEFTLDVSQFLRAMKGTSQKNPRCICLQGEIGVQVACSIYPRRSTVCREFIPSYAPGHGPNPDCDRARAAKGLPPLTEQDWHPTHPRLRPAA